MSVSILNPLDILVIARLNSNEPLTPSLAVWSNGLLIFFVVIWLIRSVHLSISDLFIDSCWKVEEAGQAQRGDSNVEHCSSRWC